MKWFVDFQPEVGSTHLMQQNLQEICPFWADFDLKNWKTHNSESCHIPHYQEQSTHKMLFFLVLSVDESINYLHFSLSCPQTKTIKLLWELVWIHCIFYLLSAHVHIPRQQMRNKIIVFLGHCPSPRREHSSLAAAQNPGIWSSQHGRPQLIYLKCKTSQGSRYLHVQLKPQNTLQGLCKFLSLTLSNNQN